MAVDVLVTGAAGALGGRIVQDLRLAGYKVVACGRVPGPCVDAQWDVSRQDRPEPDCHPGAVVHAAARVGRYTQSLEEATPLFDVNVTGTLRVVRWCEEQRVKRLVLISGAIVYGRWTGSPKIEADPAEPWWAGPYAVSKDCSEGVAAMFTSLGGEVTTLRLTSLYGQRYKTGLIPRLLQQGLETGTINLDPPFDDAFDLLHVNDAASAVRLAIANDEGGLWNVGSGALVTIRELAEECAKQVKASMIFSEADPGRPRRTINWVDDGKARADLGHVNQVPLDSGIAEIARSLSGSK